MCDANKNCDYSGKMDTAYGPKDIYLATLDEEYRIPNRISASVCPECREVDWRTLA